MLQRPLELKQYLAFRYTSRLEVAGALASIGSVGDSYDNAQAESLIGLYKLECIRPDGPWHTVDDLEIATLSWVHWFNNNRLHGALDHVPPVEYEQQHYRSITAEQQPLPHNQPATKPGTVQTASEPTTQPPACRHALADTDRALSLDLGHAVGG